MPTKSRATHARAGRGTKTAVGRAGKRSTARRAHRLTVVYEPTADGWHAVEVIGAEGVYTQGRTIEEAREMAVDAIQLMLEHAPHQFRPEKRTPPPGSLSETIFAVISA